MQSDTTIKVIVIGNSGVGKTSLCRLFFNDKFTTVHKPTVGVEFSSKEYVSKRNKRYNLNFWDIGGQERYIYMTNVYYKNADFCLVMFDLTNRESFEACSKWKQDLDLKYKLDDVDSNCPCLLVGNKSDMSNRVLDQSEIEDFCMEHGFYGYMEVSVKKDIMARETIDYIVGKIVSKREKKSKLKEDLKKEVQKAFSLKKENLADKPSEQEHSGVFKKCCNIL